MDEGIELQTTSEAITPIVKGETGHTSDEGIHCEVALKPKLLSPLVLAYIGDSVYEVFMREHLLRDHSSMPAYKLHKLNIGLVKAHAQAEGAHLIEDKLTDDEVSVYKRGRNAKSHTMPRHADMMDYRTATGLEALIGYLHLSGNQQRVEELLSIIYNKRYKSDE